MNIRPLEKSDLIAVKAFADRWIGKDYYQLESLEEAYDASLISLNKKRVSCSFVAFESFQIIGIRLTFAPNKWGKLIDRGLSPKKWEISIEQMAYFKSLFVSQEYQGKGVGRTLSQCSLDLLKKVGAKGVLCHSWLESPGNSSQNYLKKFGFIEIERHPKFWFPVEYLCNRCRPKKCECTACEMILKL